MKNLSVLSLLILGLSLFSLTTLGQQPPNQGGPQDGFQRGGGPRGGPGGRRGGGPGRHGPGGSGGLERSLISPERIMRNQKKLGLSESQTKKIVGIIKKFQGETVEMQWKINSTTSSLQEALDEFPINEKIALKKLKELNSTESDMKTRHMTLLIKLRNILTKEQFMKLKEGGPRRGQQRGRQNGPRNRQFRR